MKKIENKYKCLPFWSWNDELDENALVRQIEWMHENGVGGFFMHARGGLKTEYLGEKWFSCVNACAKRAEELGMEAYAYDENGWPSGFAGGKLLEDEKNRDMYIECNTGDFDPAADVSYDIDGEELVRTKCGENCLNLYLRVSVSTADILNPEVVDKFIAFTHEQYKKRDRYNIKGFFTDEPQYYRWATPYTRILPEYFLRTYGEDIFDGLGLLFVKKKGYKTFRYRYFKSMQALMLDSFAEKIYDWCDENGYKLTGHYVEETSLADQIMCCGGVMPFYEYEHIPGIDWLGRGIWREIAPKQLGSVAAQLGKKQTLCEMFGCAGWDVTPKELKHIAEFLYVNGVNLMCQHLLPFTEHGQRKRDYPAHFSKVNPWVRKGFGLFNDYFSALGKILSESVEQVHVAVLHPITGAYMEYDRTDANGFGIKDKDDAFAALVEDLGKRQIPHHYIDEVLLKRYGSVVGDKLVCGKCSYDYVVLPETENLDASTYGLLKEFVAAGGKLVMQGKAPTHIDGKETHCDLLTNATYDEMKAAQPVDGEYSENVRFTHRISDDGREFIYAVNLGEPCEWDVSLRGKKIFAAYDIMTDTYKRVNGKVSFDRYGSYILYAEDCAEEEKDGNMQVVTTDGEYAVVGHTGNYLTLDFARYSTSGADFGERLHTMGIFDEMLKKRYAGKLYLKYEFDVRAIPEKCSALVENTNLIAVFVNGEKAEMTGRSEIENEIFVYDVAKKLRLGKNEIVTEINYYQSESVYYALFGENVTESLKNCLAYDTDIEAIYLKGDFGVFGDFSQGKNDDILLGDKFFIGEQKKIVSCLIKGGYPFFSGDIVLKKKFVAKAGKAKLKANGRFHFIQAKVNGKSAGEMMFSDELVLSDLKDGENELELTLTVGNRNLLGPFHTEDQEDYGVGPHTFERKGQWEDGKCKSLRENYSFVKTII